MLVVSEIIETDQPDTDYMIAEEKAQAKAEKEAEKVKRQEEKRMAKEERGRLKDHPLPAHHDDHAPATEVGETAAGALTTGTVGAAAIPAAAAVSVAAAGTPVAPVAPVEPAPVVPSTEPEATIPTEQVEGMQNVEPTATHDTTTAAAEAKTSEDAKPTSPTEKQSTASPPESPTKGDKGFKSFLNKLKRKSKTEPGQIKGFSGGHRLTKEKQADDEIATNGNATSAPAVTEVTSAADTGASTRAVHETGRDSPDISSLDESDAEEEPRGRTRDSPHLQAPSATPSDLERKISVTNTNSTAGPGDEFEEARDTFDEKLSPPQPAFTSTKKEESSVGNGSPHRDSKFVENV